MAIQSRFFRPITTAHSSRSNFLKHDLLSEPTNRQEAIRLLQHGDLLLRQEMALLEETPDEVETPSFSL